MKCTLAILESYSEVKSSIPSSPLSKTDHSLHEGEKKNTRRVKHAWNEIAQSVTTETIQNFRVATSLLPCASSPMITIVTYLYQDSNQDN